MLTIVACTNPVREQVAVTPPQSSLHVAATDSLQAEQVEAVTTTIPVQERHHTIKHTYTKSADNVAQIKFEISEQTIDSLNSIIPAYDQKKYNRLAVSYFTSLATSLNGRPYYVENSDSLLKAIMEILKTRLNEGTDIVFLIDKTGSMDDDIAMVKNSLGLIFEYLSNFKKVKVGIASYGDENYHYDLWYNYVNLTTDIEEAKTFMTGYYTIGNPDIPESVNDAIVKTVETMHWTPGNRRLLLVIGDAPSQEPPFARYSSGQVIEKCEAMNVLFNLYPVIIAANSSSQADPVISRDFVKLYPNPARDHCNLDFSTSDSYTYIINDMSGRVIMQNKVYGSSIKLDLSEIPGGNYLVQVFNANLTRYYSSKLVVEH